MKYKELTEKDKQYIIAAYRTNNSRELIQGDIASRFGITRRTVRKWAKKLEVGLMAKNVTNPAKIMVYDIETPRLKFWKWWSGKGYTNGNDLVKEEGNTPRVITVAWKWLGDSEIKYLTWDMKTHDDRELIREFIKEYNKADLVVGVNNNNFDNRWINARAMYHGFHVNMFVKSLDLQKQMKKIARLPSYALKYMCGFFGITMKLQHEGIIMWEMIQEGTPPQQEEYMQKMVDYNVGDIVSTEELYFKMLPYMTHQTHFGVLAGKGKYSCPTCGTTENLIHERDTITKAGTIQRVMRCGDDETTYKISNTEFLKWQNGL